MPFSKTQPVPGPRGMQAKPHVTVLATAVDPRGILHLALGSPGQRFLEGYARALDVRLDVELALQSVDDDLEMRLAQPGDHDVSRLLVDAEAEGRVLFSQLLQRLCKPLRIGRCLRDDGQREQRQPVGYRHFLNLLAGPHPRSRRPRAFALGGGAGAKSHFARRAPSRGDCPKRAMVPQIERQKELDGQPRHE